MGHRDGSVAFEPYFYKKTAHLQKLGGLCKKFSQSVEEEL